MGVSEDIAYENLKGADEAWTLVKPFVRDHKIRYAVLMGDREVTTSYEITALPLTYLIDRRGRIAAVYVGMVDPSTEANAHDSNSTTVHGDARSKAAVALQSRLSSLDL